MNGVLAARPASEAGLQRLSRGRRSTHGLESRLLSSSFVVVFVFVRVVQDEGGGPSTTAASEAGGAAVAGAQESQLNSEARRGALDVLILCTGPRENGLEIGGSRPGKHEIFQKILLPPNNVKLFTVFFV
jgi:hypothetical protein